MSPQFLSFQERTTTWIWNPPSNTSWSPWFVLISFASFSTWCSFAYLISLMDTWTLFFPTLFLTFSLWHRLLWQVCKVYFNMYSNLSFVLLLSMYCCNANVSIKVAFVASLLLHRLETSWLWNFCIQLSLAERQCIIKIQFEKAFWQFILLKWQNWRRS